MDMAAVMQAKDEELQAIGLTCSGDILALRAFVKKGSDVGRAKRERVFLEH